MIAAELYWLGPLLRTTAWTVALLLANLVLVVLVHPRARRNRARRRATARRAR